jgi:hypothetical protein
VIVPPIRGGASVMASVFRDRDADDASRHDDKAGRHVVTWLVTRALDKGSKNTVELRGFEPLTFCMPCLAAPSDVIALGRITAGQEDICVWGRRALSGLI